MEPRPEYPRPDFRRSAWVNLNGEWEFGAGITPRFDRRIVVPFCPEARLSGIGHHQGDVLWYRRRFEAPETEALLLHFGAVDYWATVWINDIEVARHEGGHSPFTVDITSVARPGNNELVVRAVDPLEDKTIPRGKQHWTTEPEGIFYTATSGIWQTVWLEPVAARHITRLRIRPDLEEGAVGFEVHGHGRVEVLASFDNEVVGSWSGLDGEGRLQLDHVVPWHPDSPRLYELEVRLFGEDGRVSDQVSSYFGLRTVEAKDGRCWLNGKPFIQRLVLDQGYFPGGLLTAARDEQLRRDIELAKAFGFNGARKHQKAEDPRWLYWADRLGFLAWSEMPSFFEHSVQAERRLSAEWSNLVQRDRAHPSIVTWVVANETFGLDHVEASVRSRFLDHLYRLTHQLDGTRPVVSNDGWEHSRTDLCTIHDYSPPRDLARRYRRLDTALDSRANGHPPFSPGYEFSGQPVLVTEFGGLRMKGSGGWGWLEVQDHNEFKRSYGQLIEGLMERGPVEGFCYTQLADVEQERNGLLDFERVPKLKPELLRPLTQTPKRVL